MKKVWLFLLIGVVAFTVSGCVNNEENLENNNNNNIEETTKKDLAYFKEEIKKIVQGTSESETVFAMLGAIGGVKILDADENRFVEIYEFDKNSEKYKDAEKNQELCISSDYCFDVIVKNGYALLVDDVAEKDEIIALFNKLN